MRIDNHPKHPSKSSVTFESRREELLFGLNAPLLSADRWRHLTRLGPILKQSIVGPYCDIYPVTVTTTKDALQSVAERIEGEVLEQIPIPENGRVPRHMLGIMKAHIEPVPEPAAG